MSNCCQKLFNVHKSMEDIKSLVTLYLQRVFHDRQHIIEETYKQIYDYNNGDRKKIDYEKTLKNICSQVGTEVPNQVLVYLLTLVDMPLDLADSDDSQLKPVIEKIKTLEEIQKTQNCLADSIKPHLGDCVGGKQEMKKEERKDSENKRPNQKQKNKTKTAEKTEESSFHTTETLLDLAATSVLTNYDKLKRMYQRKFDKAWKLIQSNRFTGSILEQCYETLRDLNKKRKLLRDIQYDKITEDVVSELYQDVDIFLKEKHVYEAVNMDTFEVVSKLFEEKQ